MNKTITIDAREYICRRHFPIEEGVVLANTILANRSSWPNIRINLSRVPPALLISSFFDSILSHLSYELSEEAFDKIDEIKWITLYDYQYDSILKYINNFKAEKKTIV